MNYLQLSPTEFTKFVAEIRDKYNLLIVERFASVSLDKSRYGKGWVAWEKTYAFSRVTKEGDKEFITIQNGDGTALIAVIEHQYKCWKKCKIVSEPFGWHFGRIISCLAQLSHKYDLISPADDLHKLQYFLRNLFNRGEKDGQEEGQRRSQQNFEDE